MKRRAFLGLGAILPATLLKANEDVLPDSPLAKIRDEVLKSNTKRSEENKNKKSWMIAVPFISSFAVCSPDLKVTTIGQSIKHGEIKQDPFGSEILKMWCNPVFKETPSDKERDTVLKNAIVVVIKEKLLQDIRTGNATLKALGCNSKIEDINLDTFYKSINHHPRTEK